jgi:hypothetical protein
MTVPRTLVGVSPAAALEARPRLFGALASALPVRFEGRDEGAFAGLDALVEIGGDRQARAAATTGVRALAMLAEEDGSASGGLIEILAGADVDGRLRGRALEDDFLAAAATPAPDEGAAVLAVAGRSAVWTRGGLLDVASLSPRELGPQEPLRARLEARRCAALLPLLELLRGLTAATRWQPPALRAAMVLDDPNLHWPTYGFARLGELARRASQRGYHVALAMVPLDARFAHPGAARVLRETDALSLLVHGNDHFGGELGRMVDAGEALASIAQAVRRMASFERRTGLSVSRVMVPPHERCSSAVVHALARAGFDAITMTRPFPWCSSEGAHWLAGPPEAGPLTGWLPADFTPGNLPVILRHPLGAARSATESALRAYLDQPLVLYGHHRDLAGGLDVLDETAAAVDSFGGIRWCSLGELAAANAETRRDGAQLHVRPFSRRVRIAVPEGIEAIVVELPPGAADPRAEISCGPQPIEVDGAREVEVTLRRVDAVDSGAIPSPRWNPLALARRAAGEGRDRAVPMLQVLAKTTRS